MSMIYVIGIELAFVARICLEPLALFNQRSFLDTISKTLAQSTGVCGPTGTEPLHDFAAFATDPSSSLTSFWLAGLDHNPECTPGGGNDCNLTVVRVDPVPEPMTALILATGCAGLFFAKGRRRRRERACAG
jgi:hypothetical protein